MASNTAGNRDGKKAAPSAPLAPGEGPGKSRTGAGGPAEVEAASTEASAATPRSQPPPSGRVGGRQNRGTPKAAPRTTVAVQGARVHNLKNISLEIPRDSLIVVTGLSGSGKSSLAFDTIYAEGQRRYMESLSSYAKRFVAQVSKPDVDFVFGLSPVISIEQKTIASNPRSTVGTMTDIASYLNLLFATIGQPHCPRTGEPTPSRTPSQILEAILSLPEGTEIELRAPVFRVYGEELDFVFNEVRKKGCRRLIIDGKPVDISAEVELDESKVRDMDAVVDRFVVSRKHEKAIKAGIAGTLLVGDGLIQVQVLKGASKAEAERFYKGLCSPTHHFVYGGIEPEYFMFNNPESACRTCGGLGIYKITHPELLVPDPKRSILGGCFVREAFKYNPDTWDGRVMYSWRRRSSSRWKRLGKSCPSRRDAILYGIDSKKLMMSVPPDAKVKRDEWEGQGGRLRRNRAANRTAVPPLPATWRSQLGHGRVAGQGDGRAHLPRLQGRAASGNPIALHHRGQDDPRRGRSQLRRASLLPRHPRADRPRGRCGPPGAGRDPRTPGVAPGHRPRLSEPQPPLGHAVRGRVAANPPVDADRFGTHGDALRARRAEHRPAPQRQREDDRNPRKPARHRQHRHRGGARRGHRPRRGPHRRDGPRAGRPRRKRRGAGDARRRHRLRGVADRAVPLRQAVDRDAQTASNGQRQDR